MTAGQRRDPVLKRWPDDPVLKRWSDEHQRPLVTGLNDVLDIEAGLQEILLTSRYGTAVRALDGVLDVEAGLAAVLPARPARPAGRPVTPEWVQGRTVPRELFESVSPQERITLRVRPLVSKASRALDRALHLNLALDPDRTVARALVHDLALDLARDLRREADRATDIVRTRGPGRLPDLAHVRDAAVHIDRTVAGIVVLSPRSLERARGLVRVRDIAFGLAQDLDAAVPRAREAGVDLGLSLDRARALALDLDHALNHVFALGCDHNFHMDVVTLRTNGVRRALGRVLHQEPPTIGTSAVQAFLNDFTASDLRRADLGGIDLGGVRWSECGTRWPGDLDVEHLKTCSDEDPPGSGVWVVRSGTAMIRDLVGLC
ncbi:hypothetical protein [Streptomyces sp. NPDC052701]|uniref:hypothetical protein n=1 Tax=Streptomyces sp. NPDC052701 TaxID=3155533 RepID=UPI003416A1E1